VVFSAISSLMKEPFGGITTHLNFLLGVTISDINMLRF
jgi:hypothetical protein